MPRRRHLEKQVSTSLNHHKQCHKTISVMSEANVTIRSVEYSAFCGLDIYTEDNNQCLHSSVFLWHLEKSEILTKRFKTGQMSQLSSIFNTEKLKLSKTCKNTK